MSVVAPVLEAGLVATYGPKLVQYVGPILAKWVFEKGTHAAGFGDKSIKNIQSDIEALSKDIRLVHDAIDQLSKQLSSTLLELRSDHLRSLTSKITALYDGVLFALTDIFNMPQDLPGSWSPEKESKVEDARIRIEGLLRKCMDEVPALLEEMHMFLASRDSQSVLVLARSRLMESSIEFLTYTCKMKVFVSPFWIAEAKAIALLQMATDVPSMHFAGGNLTVQKYKDYAAEQERVFNNIVGPDTVALAEAVLKNPNDPTLVNWRIGDGRYPVALPDGDAIQIGFKPRIYPWSIKSITDITQVKLDRPYVFQITTSETKGPPNQGSVTLRPGGTGASLYYNEDQPGWYIMLGAWDKFSFQFAGSIASGTWYKNYNGQYLSRNDTLLSSAEKLEANNDRMWFDLSLKKGPFDLQPGWDNFTFEGKNSIATGSDIATTTRKPETMEVWWIGPNGSVQDAYWYKSAGWKQFELAPAGSATPGGIVALSRVSEHMEVWWISPSGSVEGASFYENKGWSKYQLAPPNSAAIGSKIAAVSRASNKIEVWWVGPNGSIQDGYWVDGVGWKRFELAGAGSAAIGSGLKAVSRLTSHMEVWWISPSGAVRDAFFADKFGWSQFELAPAGSAGLGTGIAAINHGSGVMEVWWIGPNGSVQDAYWIEGKDWKRFELAPAGSAQIGGIGGIAKNADSKQVWWTGTNSSLQSGFWSPIPGWRVTQIAGVGWARPGSGIGVTSRISTSLEIFVSRINNAVGDYYWYEV